MSLKPKKIDFDSMWEKIKGTIQGVITLSKIPKTVWNDRFTDVYAVCVAYPEPLGDQLYQETKNFLEEHVRNLHVEVCMQNEKNLLLAYYTSWLKFSKGAFYLHNLFSYLNTQHIRNQKFSEADLTYGRPDFDTHDQVLEIGELAFDIWKKNMIFPLETKIISMLLSCIEKDRCGDPPDYNILQGVVRSFVDVEQYKTKDSLELYEKAFETHFLEATGEYYKQQANILLQENDVSMYMRKVLQKISEENLRSRKFLHSSSYEKVTQKCVQKMVAAHVNFLYSESKSMVNEERKADLQNLYQLLLPVNGLPTLASLMQNHIKNKGLSVIANFKEDNLPALFVENVLEVYKKYSDMVKEIFAGDQLFIGALDKACAAIINHRQNSKHPCRSPELLAKYCDNLLKKTTKGINESEIDDKLAQSITIFKYIDDKDVFQTFYSKTLAKRLIQQQSLSMDMEEAMINRLKQACGYDFTNKLHRMFTDVSLSTDLIQRFNNYLKEVNNEIGINFSINVLQAGAWPFGQCSISTFALPQALEKSFQMFENFYHSHFSGRKLTWLHHLCTAEVKLNYLKKPYILTMQTYQLAILLLFETVDSLAYGELEEHTQLNSEQFSKHLQSLIEAKLLLCNVEVPDKNTVISLNTSYSNKRTKFRISVAIQKETPQELEQTHTAVDEDRKLYLQAAIVRIMKARKVLKHNALLQEVIHQCKSRFTPSIHMIKKCVEALIEKGYLERTPDSTDEFSYVA